MRLRLIACTFLFLVLGATACRQEVSLSSTTIADSDQSGAKVDDSQATADTTATTVPEEELTEAELEALAAEAAEALAVRQAFDLLVFGCGLDQDSQRCVELREVLDVEAEAELVERCGLADLVACDALERTVVADLQVLCLYADNDDACQILEDSWSRTGDSNYGLGATMTGAALEELEVECSGGDVLACAEIDKRRGS